MTFAESRTYGGVAGADRVAERRARLLEAGLELMGTRGVAATSVRGVAEQAGLAARYFYESFTNIEALHVAVFDAIGAEALDRSVTALATAGSDPREQTRAVLAEMVDLMLEDPRKGRVALVEPLASPVLGPRVIAESRRFAAMIASVRASGDLASAEDVPVEIRVGAQFLLGGFAHVLAGTLHGDLDLDRGRLVDELVTLFLARGVVPPRDQIR